MFVFDRVGETYFLPSSVGCKPRCCLHAGKVILTTYVWIKRSLDDGMHAGGRLYRFIVALQSV